jgi:hypothetical protein
MALEAGIGVRHLVAVVMAALIGAVVLPALTAPSLIRAAAAMAAEQRIALDAPQGGSAVARPALPGGGWPEEAALLIVGAALFGLAAAFRRGS